MKIVSREFICKKIAGCISKNSPEWRFWDAILWIKNAARNKQLLSSPSFVKITIFVIQSESKKAKTKTSLKTPLRGVFRYGDGYLDFRIYLIFAVFLKKNSEKNIQANAIYFRLFPIFWISWVFSSAFRVFLIAAWLP